MTFSQSSQLKHTRAELRPEVGHVRSPNLHVLLSAPFAFGYNLRLAKRHEEQVCLT